MNPIIAGLMMLSGWHFLLRRASFFACRLDKHLYVIGGRNETGYLSSVESYNLETNEWNYMSSLPQPLAAHAGAVHNGKIYISGQERSCHSVTVTIMLNVNIDKVSQTGLKQSTKTLNAFLSSCVMQITHNETKLALDVHHPLTQHPKSPVQGQNFRLSL